MQYLNKYSSFRRATTETTASAFSSGVHPIFPSEPDGKREEQKTVVEKPEMSPLKKTFYVAVKHVQSYKVVDIEEHLKRSPARTLVHNIVSSYTFEYFMGGIIMFNVGLIIYQADAKAKCYPTYAEDPTACPYIDDGVTNMLNIILLIVYTIEGLARCYATRLQFFFSSWNQLDLLVVFLGWISELNFISAHANITFLRMVRLARLLRAFRLALQIRELYLMLNGVLSSLKAICIGTFLLFTLLLTFSILLVEWAHPSNSQIHYPDCGQECTDGFRSVGHSVLTLFKGLIAGESWIVSFPLFDREPLLAPFMVFIVVTVILGLMNLILTVIVERAADARARDVADIARQKAKHITDNQRALLMMCEDIDKDSNGKITISELRDAFANSKAFRDLMTSMDLQESELEMIFKILDRDGSGYLDYEEFCDEISRYKSYDLSMLLVLTRFNVQEMRMQIERNVEAILDKMNLRLTTQHVQLASLNTKLDCLLASGSAKGYLSDPEEKELPIRTSQNDADQWQISHDLRKLLRDLQHSVDSGERLIGSMTQQVSILNSHAELVASFTNFFSKHNEAKRHGKFNHKHVPDVVAHDCRDILMRLQRNMDIQKGVLMEEAQQEVRTAVDVLDRNSILLDKFKETILHGTHPQRQFPRIGLMSDLDASDVQGTVDIMQRI